jgi:hypothetical protein
MAMDEIGVIPASGTQAPAVGETKRLTIEPGTHVVSSANIAVTGPMFPVRVTTGDDTVLVRVNVQLFRQQREIEAANEAIRRQLRG